MDAVVLVSKRFYFVFLIFFGLPKSPVVTYHVKVMYYAAYLSNLAFDICSVKCILKASDRVGGWVHIKFSSMRFFFFWQEASLYTVKAIAVLDNDGERVVAKVLN